MWTTWFVGFDGNKLATAVSFQFLARLLWRVSKFVIKYVIRPAKDNNFSLVGRNLPTVSTIFSSQLLFDWLEKIKCEEISLIKSQFLNTDFDKEYCYPFRFWWKNKVLIDVMAFHQWKISYILRNCPETGRLIREFWDTFFYRRREKLSKSLWLITFFCSPSIST